MIYRKHFGIAYDCLRYGIIHFNTELLYTDPLITENGEIVNPYEEYYEIMKYGISPDERIKPFFKRNSVADTPIMEYFLIRMRADEGIEDFIAYISDIKQFNKFIIEYMLQNKNGEMVREAINNYDNISNLFCILNEIQIGEIFHEFESVLVDFELHVKLLIEFVRKVQPFVTALHRSNEEDIEEFLKYAEKEYRDGTIGSFADIIKGKEIEQVSVCLISKVTFLIINNEAKVILGFNAIQAASLLKKYKHTDCISFLKTVSNHAYKHVFRVLKESGQAVLDSCIEEKTGLPSEIVERALYAFEEIKVINVRRVIPDKSYYTLNNEYLRYIYIKTKSYLDWVFENKGVNEVALGAEDNSTGPVNDIYKADCVSFVSIISNDIYRRVYKCLNESAVPVSEQGISVVAGVSRFSVRGALRVFKEDRIVITAKTSNHMEYYALNHAYLRYIYPETREYFDYIFKDVIKSLLQ